MAEDTVLVFGNCQAEALSAALQGYPGIAGNYNVVYLRSYNITPEEEEALLSEDLRQSTRMLIEQVTPFVRLSDRYAFDNARITTFPTLDFNLFWPLRADDPRLRMEPPQFPWGRFPYGDKIINQIIRDNLSGDEAWTQFMALSNAALPNMHRFADIERRRWTAAERLVDVPMSDFIFERYRSERLFWTYNHPHNSVLITLGARVAEKAGLAASEAEGAEIFTGLFSFAFGEDYQAPIHPLVAEALELEWYQPDMLFRRYDDHMDFETFIRAHIAWQ